MKERNLRECFNDPLSMLPGVIIFCILRQNDFSQSQFGSSILQPIDQDPTMLPWKLNGFLIYEHLLTNTSKSVWRQLGALIHFLKLEVPYVSHMYTHAWFFLNPHALRAFRFMSVNRHKFPRICAFCSVLEDKFVRWTSFQSGALGRNPWSPCLNFAMKTTNLKFETV